VLFRSFAKLELNETKEPNPNNICYLTAVFKSLKEIKVLFAI
jgi:hypothetical protein